MKLKAPAPAPPAAPPQPPPLRPWPAVPAAATRPGPHPGDAAPEPGAVTERDPLPEPADLPHDAAAPTAVVVRPYEPDDRTGVLAMRLSRQSIYRRFFIGSPHVPARYADMLTRVDHWDREALVAFAGAEVVGVAEYVRDRALSCTADLAVMVSDAWHRRGLGRRLVGALSTLALERGITELRADVLAGNRAAIAAVRSGWPDAFASRSEDGTVVYHLPLPLGR